MRGLVTGSFDPITLGHMDIIEVANNNCDELTVCMFINEKKDYFFTKKERQDLLLKALTDYKYVKIDSYDGMVFDYCKKNSIDCIYRGFRDSKDYAYETLMSEYNHINCGIITHLVPSKEDYINISSTVIKEMIDKGNDWQKLVPTNTVEMLKAFIDKRQ